MTFICSYPVLQVRPYGLLVYEHKEFSNYKKKDRSRKGRAIESYTGVITTYSKKRLKRSISLLVASAKEKEATNFKSGKLFKFRVNFLTFTLPAEQGTVDDKTIKHCLDNWIKRAKRKHHLNSYVWRAERQANGNIHFHMITDCYIHYESIRNDWNSCLRPTGLIQKFYEKHGHENPNSTDVHAVWKINNLTQYFVKYMSKKHKEGEEPIKGKVWDCSKNLKTKINCSTLLEGEALQAFDTLANNKKIRAMHEGIFSILFIDPRHFEQHLPQSLILLWNGYLDHIRGDSS
jgi:hypothetical protein